MNSRAEAEGGRSSSSSSWTVQLYLLRLPSQDDGGQEAEDGGVGELWDIDGW